jgi:RHS repeat-associated protein
VNDLVEKDIKLVTGSPSHYYAQHDANFDVTALISGNSGSTLGDVLERYEYDPYGRVTIMSPSWSTRSGSDYGMQYLFQGMRYSANSGLFRADARDYSTALGTWTEEDPAGYMDNLNLYNAFASDPELMSDPTGLFAMDLAFNAFIPLSDGQSAFDGNDFNWFPVFYPWSIFNYLENGNLRTWNWFETDNRENPGDKGTSRIHTDVTFDSASIDYLAANGNVNLKVGSDLTYRMSATATGDNGDIPGTRTGEILSKQPSPNSSVEVSNNGNSSTITVHADGGDPLAKLYAPSILMNVTWNVSTCDHGQTVTVTLGGSHTSQPAFEGIADGILDYGYNPGGAPGFFTLGHLANHVIAPPAPLHLQG